MREMTRLERRKKLVTISFMDDINGRITICEFNPRPAPTFRMKICDGDHSTISLPLPKNKGFLNSRWLPFLHNTFLVQVVLDMEINGATMKDGIILLREKYLSLKSIERWKEFVFILTFGNLGFRITWSR